MNSEQYQPALDALDLVSELKRLLVAHRRADRLICRYLADLADGMVNCPPLVWAYSNVQQFARAQLGLSFRSIRERIRVGMALRRLPLLDAALTSGELTYSRIREVTRVATPETERIWLGAARRLSMRALELNVAAAGREPRSCAGTSPSDTAPANRVAEPSVVVPANRAAEPSDAKPVHWVLDQLPGELRELLTRAMQLAQVESGSELTHAEALAAVARGAIAHFTGSTHRASSSSEGTTHSGSAEVRASAEVLVSEEVLVNDPSQVEVLVSDPSQVEVSLSQSNQGDPGRPVVGSNGPHAGMHAASVPDGMAGTENEGLGLPLPEQPLSPDEKVLLDLIYSGGSWSVAALCEATAIPPPRTACAVFDLCVRHLVIKGPFGSLEVPPPTFKRAS